jgi:hypothetical protein
MDSRRLGRQRPRLMRYHRLRDGVMYGLVDGRASAGKGRRRGMQCTGWDEGRDRNVPFVSWRYPPRLHRHQQHCILIGHLDLHIARSPGPGKGATTL